MKRLAVVVWREYDLCNKCLIRLINMDNCGKVNERNYGHSTEDSKPDKLHEGGSVQPRI